MSAVYPTFKDKLFDWAKNSTGPANVKLRLCGVTSAYAYDATHNNLADLGSSIKVTSDEITGAQMINGVLDAGDASFQGQPLGDTLAAYVLYLDWTLGQQLVCFIDESTDGTLPFTVSAPSFGVRFATAGICRI